MTSDRVRAGIVAGVALVAAAFAGVRAADLPSAPLRASPFDLNEAEHRAAETFEARVKDYVALHRKLDASLPKLPARATPEQVAANRRAFGERLLAARAQAARGDFFTPDMESLAKRTLAAVLSGAEAESLRAAIRDDNPGVPHLEVNDGYPDARPVSTMPPQVLKALPKLDRNLEYRFIGERLILMDTHARIVVDFTGDILP